MILKHQFARSTRASQHRKKIEMMALKTIKYTPAFCVFILQTIIILAVMTNVHAQNGVFEKEVGIPFYPGSRQIPNYGAPDLDKDPQSFLNISLITPDSFKKVLTFYQDKLGKFSIFKSQTLTKSAIWNESTPRGYRIVTLVESENGTRITISRRVWQSIDRTSHQKPY